MRLRNKKTGQLGNFIINKDHFECVDLDYVPEYRNLAELNSEWEDYEDSKEHWYIDWDGKLMVSTDEEGWEAAISIGNYFETKEEAEKAVERLRAWKRLKDIGCDFDGWNIKSAGSEGDHILINLYVKDCTECEGILDLLFGGEE